MTELHASTDDNNAGALPVRVIKLGGSLFDLPDLPERFQNWLRTQPPATNIIIPGGGQIVEQLRNDCQRFNTSEAVAHAAAMRAMSVTAKLTAAALSVPLVESLSEVSSAAKHHAADQELPGVIVLDTYHDVCRAGDCELPETWDVTSDSIAAWVVGRCDTAELVLLKSTLPPAECDSWQAAAHLGYVDEHFPLAAAETDQIRAVNLRSGVFPEWTTPSGRMATQQ